MDAEGIHGQETPAMPPKSSAFSSFQDLPVYCLPRPKTGDEATWKSWGGTLLPSSLRGPRSILFITTVLLFKGPSLATSVLCPGAPNGSGGSP